MGQATIVSGKGKISRAALGACALSVLLLALAPTALAVPFHARAKALDVTGLNHACGVAVDSKGDLYASSAGESKVNVYDPSHTLLTSISDVHEPCGLAVTSTGALYVSEKATGEVVRFKPGAYPFSGTPTYGSREVIDASGKAKGVSVDRVDDRLYVAEGDRVSSYDAKGNLGINEAQRIFLFETTGGSFKLKFGGQETAAIPFSASAAEVKAALEALSSIGSGNVGVESPKEKEFFVTFSGALGHKDVSLLEGDASGLTGGTPKVVLEETVKGWGGVIGEGALTEATGVAAYTYQLTGAGKTYRYLWVADANGLLPDRLELLAGTDVRALKARRELTGSTTPDGSFGFGAKGAYLAADPGNRNSEGKCLLVGEQACTEGHLFLYDAAHKALDELDASGEYLDQIHNAGFADAEPTAVAIERSGGAGDGTIYLTAGAGAGAKALAFGPLKAPSRKVLKKPSEEAGGLSQELAAATSVATGPFGYLYASQASLVHVYKPNGAEVKTEGGKVLLEDKFEAKGAKPYDIAVDSTCKVYVLDERGGAGGEELVSYYTPSACPPTSSTTYTRHEPSVITPEKFPSKGTIQAIAVNPGPAAGKDRLFVTTASETQEYDSAAGGSKLLNGKFAEGLNLGNRQSLSVNGASGDVWFGGNPKLVSEVDPSGKEILSQLENTGAANGKTGSNPSVAVDQSNNHVITFDGSTSSAREYDAGGSFVVQAGNLTEGLVKSYEIALDNGCAIHEPPLSGKACEEFDPANGTAYVAFADTSATHPPYNGINAFGPLTYSPPTKHKLTVERKGSGSGTVTGPGINCGATCSAEYLETEVVTLIAKPAAGSEFVKWTGCEAETVSPSEGTCEVTMDEDRKVVAEFIKTKTIVKEYPLTVTSEGSGSGEVTSSPDGIECPSTCTAQFTENTPVTLTAKADPGSEFVKWTGCETEPSATECEVTMTEPKEVKVEFGIEHPLLTMVKEGTGTGTVTSEPSGIDCGATCSEKFDLNAEVILTAKADLGSVFVGWGEEDCEAETASPAEGTCEVTMDEPQQVTTTFAALPRVIAKRAHPILYDEATLRGEIDPAGLATKYLFEYLTEEEYVDNGKTFEGAQKTPKGELMPGEGYVTVEAPLIGLEEGTEYRFRLRVMNSVGPAEDEGPPFATLQRSASPSCPNGAYRFGLSAKLPDCRAYELVTPAQTNGLNPEAVASATSPSGSFNDWLTPQRDEAAGERLTYFTSGTLPGFEGNGLVDGYRAERRAGAHPADGWQSELFSPSYTQAAPGPPAIQLGVASDQLYSVWELNPGPVTFPDTLPHGIYLRTPTGFEALGDPEALSRYVSPGGTHAIFASAAHLEPEAPPVENAALYDRAAGSPAAHVLTLPPHDASEEEEVEFAGALRSKQQAAYQGASEDGSTVVFKAGAGLYVRLDDANTERISSRDARAGDPLTCAAGPLYEGSQALESRHFQWLRDGTPIAGASGDDVNNIPDYIVKAADEGVALQCLTVATAPHPHSVAVSAPVWIAPLKAGQAPQPPGQIDPPAPADPTAGTVETCSPGSWERVTSFAYQWYADGKAIPGATSQTYEVQAADVPGTLQCVVEGGNAAATVAKASGLTATFPAPAQAAPVATAQIAPKTTYAGVSEDGRYVFFALGPGGSAGRLFRFDTQSETTTEIAASGIFALVSPEGSRAFFSSKEVLTGSEENENCDPECEMAGPGVHNLYVWDGTTVHFIGGLSASDFKKGGFTGIPEMTLGNWTQAIAHTLTPVSGRALAPTRSTPGGGTFVFQSHARLTAFDNEGVGEVYRYDSGAVAGERLLCVSCDPSGSPSSADALLEDIRNGVGRPSMVTTMIANLTDDGNAVFFQSFDRLSPEDVNDVEDVYEWKANGSGGCTRPGGCLALISSGQGEGASGLYAMSADGHDVFFYTQEKLVGIDVAGSPSLYDARVGGGVPEPAEPAPCQGDACQGQGSPPPVLPDPMTGGPGEEPQVEVPATRKPCAKGKHRVKGRCVAVKRHKHRKRHHRHARANAGGSR